MQTTSLASKGKSVSISAELAYRIVSDLAKDGELSDSQRLKQVRKGNVSFEPLAVREN